jgi:rod shape-determining protein MreB
VVELGIDLGTSSTVVCDLDQGIVLDEPSVLVLRGGSRTGQIVAVGHDAAELVGRAPLGLIALRPVLDGVVTDLETARTHLRSVFRRAVRRPWQRRAARTVIGVPTGATGLERRALLEAAEEAGILRPAMLDEPIAAAVGCGLDPLDRRVHMVVDVGGGTSEAVAFCYGGVLAARCSRVAGDEMTLAVRRHLRDQHHVVVTEDAAEKFKIRAGAGTEPSIVVQGRDVGSGRPRLATVPVAELVESVQPVVDSIVRTLAACLDDLGPQAVDDVMADGVLLLGGASLVPEFERALEQAFGFPVKRADRPLTCVAEGAARALRLPGLLARYGRF